MWNDVILTIFQDISEINTVIAERKEKSLNLGLTVQPCMFALRSDSATTQYYVLVDCLQYKLPTVLKCFHVIFMLHQVFNLKYAPECKNVYMFLQRSFYNIVTKFDNRNPAVTQLEKQMKDE